MREEMTVSVISTCTYAKDGSTGNMTCNGEWENLTKFVAHCVEYVKIMSVTHALICGCTYVRSKSESAF